MLTKNVASVVGQKCDPMFFWLWMAHPSMLAWIKNLIPSSSAWGHKKYGSEIVSLATSVSLFFWLWISHPSDLEPQNADFPSLGPSSQKKCGHSSVLWCVTKLLCCQSPPLPPHVRYKKCEYIFKLFLCDAAACWIFKTPMLIIPNP